MKVITPSMALYWQDRYLAELEARKQSALRITELEDALRELVDHVNSLPEGHYSAWLTWWAKEAAALAGKR